MDKLLRLLYYLPVIILAVVIIAYLFPRTSPLAGIKLTTDPDTISARGTRLLDTLGIPSASLALTTELKQNTRLYNQMQNTFGTSRANEMSVNGVPLWIWRLKWKSSKSSIFRAEGDGEKAVTSFLGMLKGEYSAEYSTSGNLLSFESNISDSLRLPAVDSLRAYALAAGFLERFTSYVPEGSSGVSRSAGSIPIGWLSAYKVIVQPYRTDHQFSWSLFNREAGDSVRVSVSIAGSRVSSYRTEYVIPSADADKNESTIHDIAVIVIYIGLIVSLLIIGFQRTRRYEIGFKNAIMVSITIAVTTAIGFYFSTIGESFGERLLISGLMSIFYGGSMVVLWAITESIAREYWSKTMIPLDLIRNGYIIHSRTGSDFLKGAAFGLAAAAVGMVIQWLLGGFIKIGYIPKQEFSLFGFNASYPGIALLCYTFTGSMFITTFLILFQLALFRRWIRSSWLLIVVVSIIAGVIGQEEIRPVMAGIVIETIELTLVVWVMYRFDFLTALTAMFSLMLVPEVAALLSSGAHTPFETGSLIVGLFAIGILAALVVQLRRGELTSFDDIRPAFAKVITERQRLQQELEIARQVQMSLLPKSNPVVPHLEIASRCVPAEQVGGDYFDFIPLESDRLGVAIGDVSGKGIQAAFFMTLTKGFLRALIKVSNSPSEVLAHVNRLFYENVDRGTFISMAYGIFDSSSGTFSIARAGHNPVILKSAGKAKPKFIQQKGLALGLNSNPLFVSTIQETCIQFQQGDIFVLYTDGFTEAMNKAKEEYGDERLLAAIEQSADGTAATILDALCADVKRFTGSAEHRDDMTMVVVRII